MTDAAAAPDYTADIALLKAALPPIFDDYNLLLALPFTERVIDLEWDEDTGELTTIGVGNHHAVVQIDWQKLNALERIEVRADIEKLITTGVTIYHNADADIRKMRQHGFAVTAASHALLQDTMLADAVLDSEEAHDLGDVNKRRGRMPDFKHLRKVCPREYNAGDIVATYYVWQALELALLDDPKACAIYRQQSIPFIDIAIEGEEAGLAVDSSVAIRLRDKYTEKIEQASRLAIAHTGLLTFNIGSSDQVKHWLYNVEGMPVQRKRAPFGEQGAATVDKDALSVLRRLVGTEWADDEEPTLAEALENIDEGGNALLEAKYLYSGAHQRLTHYVQPCFEGEVPRLRIYPECRQHTQASGRHSYVGPAMQQLRGETTGLVMPDPGFCWIGHDWSQIEVRLLAVLSQDPVYLSAYAAGDDIHEMNVRAIFGPPGSPELEKTRRRWAKAFCFRLHYRGKPENAGDIPGTRSLNLDVPQLVAASGAYLGLHPALPVYWRAVEHEADTTGMVRTFMGRPRRLTGTYRAARMREACNHPMQGGVADIYVTTALLVKQAAPWARLAFGAHDAMWWQVPVDRKVEFLVLYAPIVERSFVINGHTVNFPAEFKLRDAVTL